MKRFFKVIWENRWMPDAILDKVVESRYVKYDTPHDMGIFGTDYGYVYERKERTEFGKKIDNLPAWMAFIFLIFFRILIWPIWIVLCMGIDFIKFVIKLFTKKWGET